MGQEVIYTTVFSGLTDISELFLYTKDRSEDEIKEYYEKKRLEEEKRNWISENVYHRQILFEKTHWINKPGVTMYSGSTDLGNIFRVLNTPMNISVSSRSFGNND